MQEIRSSDTLLPTYRTAQRHYPKMATRSVGAEKTSDHTCSVYVSLRCATLVVNCSRLLGRVILIRILVAVAFFRRKLN
jgi:hypothetical protein